MLRKTQREDPFADPRPFASDESDANTEFGMNNEEGGEEGAEGSFSYERSPRDARTQSVIDANSAFDGRFDAGQDMLILGSLSGEIICKVR